LVYRYFLTFKNKAMPYSPLLIKPLREEVTNTGVKELLTPQDVDNALNQSGTTLIFVNSVCGCAASIARPAVNMMMQDKSGKKPDHVFSVFAGQDLDATARLRMLIPDVPPSSPCFAFFQDKELVGFIPKNRIEARDPQSLANDLLALVEQHA